MVLRIIVLIALLLDNAFFRDSMLKCWRFFLIICWNILSHFFIKLLLDHNAHTSCKGFTNVKRYPNTHPSLYYYVEFLTPFTKINYIFTFRKEFNLHSRQYFLTLMSGDFHAIETLHFPNQVFVKSLDVISSPLLHWLAQKR